MDATVNALIGGWSVTTHANQNVNSHTGEAFTTYSVSLSKNIAKPGEPANWIKISIPMRELAEVIQILSDAGSNHRLRQRIAKLNARQAQADVTEEVTVQPAAGGSFEGF